MTTPNPNKKPQKKHFIKVFILFLINKNCLDGQQKKIGKIKDFFMKKPMKGYF
jgi:hypothetical protein